ncbi:MAG: type IV secretion system protein, partial [Rickettsiales bacterium]
MRSIIDAAVEGILKSMDTLLNSAMLAAIILAVTLFGVQILSGSSQRPGPDAFVLLLKIGFVLIFTNILLKGYDSQMFNLFGIMEDMSGYAMSYISNDNSTLLKGCSAVGNGQLMIWQQVDCILERLFAGDEQDGASVLWILAHAVLWSNILGLFVFVAMVQIFVMILLLVLRCVTVFLTAYIMLGFLILISPLIVPMILFERTAQYFQVWLRQVLAMFVQPLILFAFMTFCFALLDTVFFGSDDPNIPDGVALSDILGDGWENPHRVPVYYIGDGNPDGSRTLQDAMRDFQERRGISEDCDKAEDDKECQQWKAEIKNYQKYLENRTQVIGVGVAAMKREYLINIDLHVTEEAVSQIPAVGGWGPVKNAAKVVDEVASWTADKVAHWLIPFKVWRVQDTSIFMDLLKFFLGLLFFLPVMNEFVKQMPELVRGLSSARRVSGMT